MKIDGTVCVSFSQENPESPLTGVLTFTDENGQVVYESEPFPVTAGNRACFGPMCVECELGAQFSYEPTGQGAAAATPTTAKGVMDQRAAGNSKGPQKRHA